MVSDGLDGEATVPRDRNHGRVGLGTGGIPSRSRLPKLLQRFEALPSQERDRVDTARRLVPRARSSSRLECLGTRHIACFAAGP
jgi:hypothetical protein